MMITTLLITCTDIKQHPVLVGYPSREEAIQNLKEYVCNEWSMEMDADTEPPTPETITEEQIKAFFYGGSYSYEIRTNPSLSDQKVYIFSKLDEFDLTLKAYSTPEKAEVAYKQHVFDNWGDVVCSDCPVESADLLTDEMIDEFNNELGNAQEYKAINWEKCEVQ